MKKDFARWKLFVVAVVAFLIVSVNVSVVYAQPLLVMQPAYAGMTFYVHQPYGIPQNWYTTFDGYPVWKGVDGVWFYGSYSGTGIIQTNYVVGAVVPSVIGIHPFVTQAAVAINSPSVVVQTDAVTTLPAVAAPTSLVVASPAVAAPTNTNVVTYSAPVAATAVVPVVVGVNPRFMVLGTWRGNVDRVGILVHPSIPVAWKGMWPKVLYAWTGSQWYQMTVRDGERPGDVLRNNLYALTRLAHQNGNHHWQAPDVAFLINQTAIWGYVWMGQIGPNPRQVY